ncbi:hypothetical protein FOL47_006364 [Perkinsus chesapeaki]|uniref:Uncharacterized protein n=1 Tax=Perkinsus chesapeaki TaxID=330153 RepID=A0A7J6LSK5_PERCH|nr:hypothetical protein FOL47_006364 [Perkinsus chesapeaki]
MVAGGNIESARMLLTNLATTCLMIFHLTGCENDCSFDIGTYEGSLEGVSYNVMIDYAEFDAYNADLTFKKDGGSLTCEGCEFGYLRGVYYCPSCGESPDDLKKLVEYGNIGSFNYIGMYIPDGCTLYYLTSQKSPDVELMKVYD